MKQQLTQEQVDIIHQVEQLRQLKERCKAEIADIQNTINNYDIMIRDLRQKLGNITIEVREKRTSKPVETNEQKLTRLKEKRTKIQQEIAELDALLGDSKP